jgi:hypothetical protein
MNKKNVPCARCKYCQPDPSASERNWTAYECTK